MTVQTAPSLERYRLRHRIQVDDSGPLPVCATDGIRIHPTRAKGWVHDAPTITRLHRASITAMLDAIHPITYVSEVDGNGLAEAKRASEIACDDAWARGTLTFESHGHAVDVDLA